MGPKYQMYSITNVKHYTVYRDYIVQMNYLFLLYLLYQKNTGSKMEF